MDFREQDISTTIADTFNWLFDTDQFKVWQDTPNGVLCITGKPGAGKSTLMKHTLTFCKMNFSDHLIVAYFFTTRGSALQKTPLGMMRSIIYQLLQNYAKLLGQFIVWSRDMQIIYGECGWEWQRRDLETFLLLSTLKQWISKPLLLFVDALDECHGPDRQHVTSFLESLSSNAQSSGADLRICLSRRHQPALDIKKCLEITVEKNDGRREDIAKYVRAELPQRNNQIEDEINNKADGIFLWVDLVIRRIKQTYVKGMGEDDMRKTLEEVPDELEALFEDLLNKGDPKIAKTVLMFQWVLFSLGLLTPEELFFAVEVGTAPAGMQPWNRSKDFKDSIQRHITYLSKGLIEVWRQGTAVKFIHPLVSDFFLRNSRLQTLDQTLEPNPVVASHYRLWACCWSYIKHFSSTETQDEYKELLDKYPFLRYAAMHILDHAEKVLAGDAVGQSASEIGKWPVDFKSWFKRWKGFYNAVRPLISRDTSKKT